MIGDAMRELVTAAQHGDDRALHTLIRDVIAPTARATCRTLHSNRWTRDSAIGVDDITQLAVIGAVRALPRFEARGAATLQAYVRRIASHKVYEVFRADTRSRSAPVAEIPEVIDPSPRPDEAAERAADVAAASAAIEDLLADLTPRMRGVLMLRIGHELPSDEVAAALGTTPIAVRVTQHRALAAIRRRLPRMDVAA